MNQHEMPAATLPQGSTPAAVDASAMFKLSYGLFILTAAEGGRDNGCVINTAIQITTDPQRISIAVNKANLTHDMIKRTGVFTLSVLTEQAPFSIFQRFGYQSGRTADKFEGFTDAARGANGLLYLTGAANAMISGRVVGMVDCGSHTVFFAEVTEAMSLSDAPSVTYAYYFAHIKPKPQPQPEKKKGWVCKICGYIYEGEVLPPDFICPICKHGAADFEKL